MDSFASYRSYTRPALADLLEILGLQYEFQEAEGDVLRGVNGQGQKIEVFDFLGGYGSTLLGHNSKAILECVEQFHKRKGVIHAQASVRTSTAKLAKKLNDLLIEELKETGSFITTLGNSGAEAVEIAIKHALLEWKNRKRNLILDFKSRNQFDEIEKIESCEPKILAFQGGFHGKTAAAVSVTENESYSSMYSRKTLNVQFLDRQMDPREVEKIDFTSVIGLIFEPIQGEGGIHPISAELLLTLQKELKIRSLPLIADEIQSGLYRTGTLCASRLQGVQPDYILFGKSLGGGVSKIAATIIHESHYQYEFGRVHTSTFAEDDLSAEVALCVLQELEKNKVDLQKKAIQFETQIYQLVEKIKSRFPSVVVEARGSGFFMGLEFDFSDQAPHASFLKFIFDNGYATYVFTSYLLHRHQVRVGVTLSAPSTIRLEPSYLISEAAVEKLSLGLLDLCELLSERKMAALMGHLWRYPVEPTNLQVISDRATPRITDKKELKRVGFLSHVINVNYLRKMERAFTGVHSEDLERFLNLYLKNSGPARYHEQLIEGANGEKVILNVYGMMTASHQFEADLRNKTRETLYKVQEAVDLATADGCEYFGLGQFSSIVSGNGLLLDSKIPLTTGNSLTAGMAYRAVERVVKDRFQSRRDLKIGVVGFTGNICLVVSQLLADLDYPMTLVYREPYATSDRFKMAVQELLSLSKASMDQLTFAHQIEAVHDCDIILIGTNSSKEFVQSSHIKSNAVILDISVPTNVSEDVRKRPDVMYFQGGFARFPFDQKLSHIWAPTFGTKNWFACMTETLACGLLDIKQPFSLGALNKSRVLESLKLADQLGIELGDLRRA